MVLLGLFAELRACAAGSFLWDGAGRSACRPNRSGPSRTPARGVEPAFSARRYHLSVLVEPARLRPADRQSVPRRMGFGQQRSTKLLLSSARRRLAVLRRSWSRHAAADADDAGVDRLSAATAAL